MSKFIGCEASYQESKIVLFGAPFDGTTSYRPGARFAPSHIRNESYSIETYSPYQDKDLTDYAIADEGDLEFCFGNTQRVVNEIYSYVKTLVNDDKLPFMLGGEHLVTLGAVKALSERYTDLHIIHFDAHSDCRDAYLDEKLSHATVMRRCHECVGDGKIFQFGIRSGDRDEFAWAKKHITTRLFDCEGLETIVKQLQGKPVYVTVDLDVLDSSVFCGTGTPEAGGISFKELLNSILALKKINIVGFDINELSPPYDQSGASTSLACKFLRECLLMLSSESV